MIRLFRFISALFVVALIAACAPPAPPVSIRGGIGQTANLDAIRPPSGVTYRYQMETDGVPVPVELRLRSKRRSASVYDYRGNLTILLPEADNLEEIGRLIGETLKVDDIKIGIQGNKLLIPVNLRTDNRFRSLSSSLVLLESKYAPHDCFAVIGTCRYTAFEGDKSIALVAETTEKNGVWRTRTKPDPRKRKPGQQTGAQSLVYSIDKNAVLIDMVLTSVRGGQRSSVVFRRK
ncbi:hypothetical protein [uncultured Litoreibacter sp.]|uniref:hypothetical protein n=1 Tax=uncultured Litoreibacter sp. TaxID=1392394 RepID=UPI00260241E1|nr:hypothetical protein [uncultured Litoreibacter sp.]